MSLRSYRLLMLSPVGISLRVALQRTDWTRDDQKAWWAFAREVEAALGPLPAPPPAPLLRWTCKPLDYDPTWTVDDLGYGRWMQIGANQYHHITGRCRTGRATFHGRLWNPRAQDETWRRWKDECRRPQDERDREIRAVDALHRAAVADRLERYASTYEHKGRDRYRCRAYFNDVKRHYPDLPPELADRHAWVNLSAFRVGDGVITSISGTDMRENYRLVRD